MHFSSKTLVFDAVVVYMNSDLDANPDDAAEDVTSLFRISNETAKRTERTTTLLLLKSGTCVEADKPIEDQLYVVRCVGCFQIYHILNYLRMNWFKSFEAFFKLL